MSTSNNHNNSSAIPIVQGILTKSDDTDNNNLMMMAGDSTPLLVATPLVYGATATTTTTEPEMVTFDESARVMPPVVVGSTRNNNDNDNQQQDPLLLHGSAPTGTHEYKDDEATTPHYRDVCFAFLFWIQLGFVIWLGYAIAPKGYDMLDLSKIKDMIEKDPDTSPTDIEEFETFIGFMGRYFQVYPERIVTYLLYPTSLLAFGIALIWTSLILRPHPQLFVTFCLIGTLVDTTILVLLVVIGSGFSPGALFIAMILLSVVTYYVIRSWKLIPHSSVNLGVALEGVQSNCGIYIVALCLAEIGFLWAFYWFYTMAGTMIYVGETQCPDMDPDTDDCGPQGWTFLLMLLSFFWTGQVISNTIQVTVAGVMATWSFDYDFARNCCSSAVWTSLYRSLTYSFGSICFGSLLMGVVRVIRYFADKVKGDRSRIENDICDCSILYCLIQCFEEVLDYFNHWSYVFCGIYGYSYLQSGKMVVELFRARGWETIVTDDLIGLVLAFTTFTVGCLTGLGCMFVERIVDARIEPDSVAEGVNPDDEPWEVNQSFLFGPLPNPQYLALGFGFLIGIIVCSIMMVSVDNNATAKRESRTKTIPNFLGVPCHFCPVNLSHQTTALATQNVVRGAVNTLIVCWADSPARLEENHPEATKEMAETWTKVFPDARINLAAPMVLPSGAPVF